MIKHLINNYKYAYAVLFLFFSCKDSPHQASAVVEKEDTTLKWVDYRVGELPPVGYYDATDSMVRKWAIRYERVEGGCEINDSEKMAYEKRNPEYFRLLEQRFGKDWRTRFDAEVATLDSILSTKQQAPVPEPPLVKAPQTAPSEPIKCFGPEMECKDKGGDMENGFVESCDCHNCSLEQAYTICRNNNISNDIGHYLEAAMPLGNKTIKKKGDITIIYTYRGADALHIEMQFPGGITSLDLHRKEHSVHVGINRSPD